MARNKQRGPAPQGETVVETGQDMTQDHNADVANGAAEANEAAEATVEAGQPKTDLTPEQKAALKAEEQKRKADEKEAEKARKKAEREALVEQRKKNKEKEKEEAKAAKEKAEQERLEALKPLAEAVTKAEQAVTDAKTAVQTALDNLTKARAEYKAAGGKGLGGSGDGLVDRSITSRYVAHDVKTPGGRKSTNNDDNLARATMGMSGEQLIAVLDSHGIEHKDWSHLNAGMQRMNAGNVLRSAIKKGKPITIVNGDQTYEVTSLHD